MNRVGLLLSRFLEKPLLHSPPFDAVDPALLQGCLRPGDVLLVEGNSRISLAIKYLTQSTWSHAALYVGDALRGVRPGYPAGALIEADLRRGVVAVPIAKYATFNTRICRPVGLSAEDCRALIEFMVGSLGKQYDLRHVFDLMRYLLPQPPVPVRWRRRMLALGSGDPTRAICSTLIAQAFQSVRYPILPEITSVFVREAGGSEVMIRELQHIRDYSLFTPRDFDVSPYFQIVKPTIERKFNYKSLSWAETDAYPGSAPGDAEDTGNEGRIERHRQVNFLRPRHSGAGSSSNGPTPFSERTDPELPIMPSPDQVSTQVKQIMNRSMGSDESLSLAYRFELSHAAFPGSGRLM